MLLKSVLLLCFFIYHTHSCWPLGPHKDESSESDSRETTECPFEPQVRITPNTTIEIASNGTVNIKCDGKFRPSELMQLIQIPNNGKEIILNETKLTSLDVYKTFSKEDNDTNIYCKIITKRSGKLKSQTNPIRIKIQQKSSDFHAFDQASSTTVSTTTEEEPTMDNTTDIASTTKPPALAESSISSAAMIGVITTFIIIMLIFLAIACLFTRRARKSVSLDILCDKEDPSEGVVQYAQLDLGPPQQQPSFTSEPPYASVIGVLTKKKTET